MKPLNFKDEGLTLGSLKYWAKTDNYDGYMELQRANIQYHIERSMTGTHYDVALVLYHMFRDFHQFPLFHDYHLS